ncbi:hypothetical protein [Emticicia sp. TH156]|uniref:hypothetical protein n=1 Tax=Emticicia sp. TH156 TaxID=2067454 RepID=UPI000C78B195|nr:hypothetical protein [Emticicia sp. TH156]PLK46198.1 hypothetical protein C0V77_02285 [Emticicia sp. TH156]
MKKIITTAMLCFLSFLSIRSLQAQGFYNGPKTLNAGLFFGYGTGVGASFDARVHEYLSVGAMGAFTSQNYIGGTRSSVSLSARGAFHAGKLINQTMQTNNEDFDPYAGILVGLRAESYLQNQTKGLVGIFVGGRYYFQSKLGIYMELGAPYSSVGITYKF